MLKESEIVGRMFNLLQGITPPKQTVYYIRDSYNPAGKITGLEGPYTSEVNAKTAVSIITIYISTRSVVRSVNGTMCSFVPCQAKLLT